MGLCNADIAEAADCPVIAEFTDCGRAFEMPAMGSDLEGVHIPRAVRFRDAQSPPPFAVPLTPFTFGAVDAVDTVDVLDVEELDASEFSDDEEFERVAVLRGISILSTSALMLETPFAALLGPLHRFVFDKFMGGATAVI